MTKFCNYLHNLDNVSVQFILQCEVLTWFNNEVLCALMFCVALLMSGHLQLYKTLGRTGAIYGVTLLCKDQLQVNKSMFKTHLFRDCTEIGGNNSDLQLYKL